LFSFGYLHFDVVAEQLRAKIPVKMGYDQTCGFSQEHPMPNFPENGMVHLRSPYPVSETLQRLESILQTHGIAVFCRVNHSGEAAKVGLKMRPTEVLIFGNPKGGTPLMIASPTLAIDLPLKALAWEDPEGNTWLSYNSAEYLQRRHDVSPELMKNLAGAETLLQQAVQ
jgi:uncharacterized protein (DUF302 family)